MRTIQSEHSVSYIFKEPYSGTEASLETKVEPFWELVRQNASILIEVISKRKSNPEPDPTSPGFDARTSELLKKLERQTLTSSEAKELQQILERQFAEAKARGDTGAILALLLLLGLVAAFLATGSWH